MKDNMPQPRYTFSAERDNYNWPNWWRRNPYWAGVLSGVGSSAIVICTCVELVWHVL